MFWKRKQRKRVRLYDPETRRITEIPMDELAPGMIRASFPGIEGEVWIEPGELRPNEYQYAPFDDDVRACLRQIKAALDEVYPQSLEQWEDGFRRDQNAEEEIAIWVHISRIYRDSAAGPDVSPDRKRETFAVLIACANSGPEAWRYTVSLRHLTEAEAQAIARRFFGGDPAS
jgi:hypothetical protein